MVAYIVDIQNVGVIMIRRLPITKVRSECHSFMNGHARKEYSSFGMLSVHHVLNFMEKRLIIAILLVL
jgi:hypothetical protein